MALPQEAHACRHDLGVGGGAPEIGVVIKARIPVASELRDKPGPARPSRFDQIEVEFCKNSWFQNILTCGMSRIFPSARLQVYASRPPTLSCKLLRFCCPTRKFRLSAPLSVNGATPR